MNEETRTETEVVEVSTRGGNDSCQSESSDIKHIATCMLQTIQGYVVKQDLKPRTFLNNTQNSDTVHSQTWAQESA